MSKYQENKMRQRYFFKIFTLGILILLSITIFSCKESTTPPERKKALDIVLSPTLTYFGHIPISSSATRPIVVFNSSDETVEIQKINLSGNSGVFTWLQNDVKLPVSLAPLEFLELNIRFEPKQVEKSQAFLTMATTAGSFVDTLEGFGVAETNGVRIFERIIGSPQANSGSDVIKATDGGLLIVGSTMVSTEEDYPDIYIVKTDALGKVLWEKNYGGKDTDQAGHVIATSDGGYLIVGITDSFGAGGEDVYLLKIDAQGTEEWTKTLGGGFNDVINQIVALSSGNYLMVGATIKSNGQDRDAWLVQIDESGDVIWNKTFGSTEGGETFSGIQQADDGGYFFVGSTTSYGNGGFDVYLVKVDVNGNEQWFKTYGGSDWDEASKIRKMPDGTLIISGYTSSKGAGARDIYLLKVDQKGNLIWDKTYGTPNNDAAGGLLVDQNGNIYISGSTVVRKTKQKQYVDIYMCSTNSEGQIIWEKIFGGKNNESIGRLIFDNDGGIIGCGSTDSYSKANDVYLVKFPTSGIDF